MVFGALAQESVLKLMAVAVVVFQVPIMVRAAVKTGGFWLLPAPPQDHARPNTIKAADERTTGDDMGAPSGC
jgi:hypothetical protein